MILQHQRKMPKAVPVLKRGQCDATPDATRALNAFRRAFVDTETMVYRQTRGYRAMRGKKFSCDGVPQLSGFRGLVECKRRRYHFHLRYWSALTHFHMNNRCL